MITKEQIFSNDFQVCLKIYEFNQRNEKIWFNKLVKEMNGTPTQLTISKSLDKLFDRGVIDGEWEISGPLRGSRATFSRNKKISAQHHIQ